MEIRDFTTSMIDISHRASTFYTNLSTQMDPTQAVKLLDANTKLQKATQDIQRDSNLMKLGTTETPKCNYANLTLDHKYLLEEVMEHEDYLSAEDQVIIQGMKQRKEWKEMMNKITKDLLHLTITTTSNHIPSEIINIHTIENKVNTLQALLLAKIKTIEMADSEQCLLFDLLNNPYPLKIPTFSGTFSEDFKAFEKNFNEAAKDNKVSKTDQPGVLKSTLRGNAKEYIFLGPEMSIDHTWAKHDIPHQQGKQSTTPGGTQTNPEPRETTTSTQTKNTKPKRLRQQSKYMKHHQARHRNSITKKKWSPRQGPTLSRISFFCTVVLHQKTNRPRLTAILELKNTTLQVKLQPPTTHTITRVNLEG